MNRPRTSAHQRDGFVPTSDVVSLSPFGRGRGEGEQDKIKPESVQQTRENSLSKTKALIFAFVAVLSFHLAYSVASLSFFIFIYLACLLQLSRLPAPRIAFYFGLGTGFFCALQAFFFWNIFGPTAISLWLILAFWTALFVALAQITRARLSKTAALLLVPFLWTGLEYFRSELYYLRFSWLNVGYVFSSGLNWLPLRLLGMYGIGFCLIALVCLLEFLRPKTRLVAGGLAVVGLATLTNFPSTATTTSSLKSGNHLAIAGVQLEFPSELEVIASLDKLQTAYPDTPLFVLSEYTFTGPIPETIKHWCRRNHHYLIIGGEEPAPNDQYRDTAFVIGPDGKTVFQQAKSVPIQFFKDGLPAESQKLWSSPWGKIGICICYDLSYTRVTDQLIRLGAQAIIVPGMDVTDWGRHQHELHFRVAPIRAAEYRIPIFRLASSGISQCVNASGIVLATAPFPGGATISSTMDLDKWGTLPLDRNLAPFAVVLDALLIIYLIVTALIRRENHKTAAAIP